MKLKLIGIFNYGTIIPTSFNGNNIIVTLNETFVNDIVVVIQTIHLSWCAQKYFNLLREPHRTKFYLIFIEYEFVRWYTDENYPKTEEKNSSVQQLQGCCSRKDQQKYQKLLK